MEGAKIADLAIHLRGSHWTLGSGRAAPIPAASSLARISRRFPPDRADACNSREWLTQPDHPLTSRVMANRIWRWHFGRGIVPVDGQFRTAGRAAHAISRCWIGWRCASSSTAGRSSRCIG